MALRNKGFGRMSCSFWLGDSILELVVHGNHSFTLWCAVLRVYAERSIRGAVISWIVLIWSSNHSLNGNNSGYEIRLFPVYIHASWSREYTFGMLIALNALRAALLKMRTRSFSHLTLRTKHESNTIAKRWETSQKSMLHPGHRYYGGSLFRSMFEHIKNTICL